MTKLVGCSEMLLLMTVMHAARATGPAHQPSPHTPAPNTEVPVAVKPPLSLNCTVFESDPSWFEMSCPMHLPENTSQCIARIYGYGAHAHEGESTLHNDLEHSEAPHSIMVIFGSFAVGALVRNAFKDTSVPYTVVLFVIGMLWGALGVAFPGTFGDYSKMGDMDPHLIFHIFLPVLIFESAFAMQISVFKKVVGQCLILAGPGIMVAAFLTAAVMKVTFTTYNWTWPACLLLGTILSATDPVAVVALLKELGASPVISTMIEGESLFNDGTAIVLFNVLKAAVLVVNCEPEWETCVWNGANTCLCQEYTCSIPKTITEILTQFCLVSFGGPVVGLLVGGVAVISLQRVFNDALIEITITIVAAYVTFFFAEGILSVSGVLGVVACGLVLSYHKQSISPEVEHTMHHFWETVVYLTNTMIFLLAGMIVSIKAFEVVGPMDFIYLGIIYATINVVRVVVLVLMMPLLMCFDYKLSGGEIALVAWGGLRGAVGLALALIIQADTEVTPESVRTKFVFHVAGIVILTLCINGVTTKKLVEYYGLNAIPGRNKRMMRKRFEELVEEQQQTIEDLRREALYYDTNWEKLDRIVDLYSVLPTTKHVDPYSTKGERLRETAEDARLEAKYVYLSSVQASVHRQYARGTLEAQGARDILYLVDSMRNQKHDTDPNNPESWLQAEMLRPYFDLSKVMCISEPREVTGLQMLYLLRTWRHAFGVTLGWVDCHKLVLERASSLLTRQHANRLITHCKRATTQARREAEETILQRSEISCMIKTKHAARYVLNHMKQLVAIAAWEGRVDDHDRAALSRILEDRMKNLRNFPSTLRMCSASEALKDTPWFQEAEDEAKEHLVDALGLGTVFELHVKPQTPVEQYTQHLKELSGLYVVVSGIVEVRVGRNLFRYGPGYTIGIQQLLTPNSLLGCRFSNAWTESRCRFLYLPFELLEGMVKRFPALHNAFWKQGGVASCSILMAMDPHDSSRYSPTTVRHLAENKGKVEFILDPDEYRFADTRRVKIPDGCSAILLRGTCWEYEIEAEGRRINEFRFPSLLPKTFRFATFTGHAALFLVPQPSESGDIARRHWRRLRMKIRSINLWVGLLGDWYRQNAIATVFGVPPRDEDSVSDSASVRAGSGTKSASRRASTTEGGSASPGKLKATVATLTAENRALQQALAARSKVRPSPERKLHSGPFSSPLLGSAHAASYHPGLPLSSPLLPPSDHTGVVATLQHLTGLYERGALTEAEFARAKQKVLGGGGGIGGSPPSPKAGVSQPASLSLPFERVTSHVVGSPVNRLPSIDFGSTNGGVSSPVAASSLPLHSSASSTPEVIAVLKAKYLGRPAEAPPPPLLMPLAGSGTGAQQGTEHLSSTSDAATLL